MYQFLSTVFKIALTSLIVGAVLSFVDITAADLLGQIGFTAEDLWVHFQNAITWAIPNVILGSLIVIPVWIIIYLFRPPNR